MKLHAPGAVGAGLDIIAHLFLVEARRHLALRPNGGRGARKKRAQKKSGPRLGHLIVFSKPRSPVTHEPSRKHLTRRNGAILGCSVDTNLRDISRSFRLCPCRKRSGITLARLAAGKRGAAERGLARHRRREITIILFVHGASVASEAGLRQLRGSPSPASRLRYPGLALCDDAIGEPKLQRASRALHRAAGQDSMSSARATGR